MTASDGAVGPREHRRILALAFGAFVVVFILWQVAANSVVLYPFRLLVTFAHESGHGLSAILTGGRFLEFKVFQDGSGVAYMSGGSAFVWLQMGYLGAALFGAILLYATNRTRRVRYIALVTGLYFIACALLFTGQSASTLIIGLVISVALWIVGGGLEKESMRNARLLQIGAGIALVVTLLLVHDDLALVVGIIAGTLLIAVGALATAPVTTFVLNFIALITGFNAVNDIIGLWNNTNATLMLGGQNPVRNDAAALADYTKLPVQVWLLVWIVLAVAMMGAAAYFSLIRPARKQ